MSKYRMSEDDIPRWLLRLPPAEYTLNAMVERTGAMRNNIYMRMEALEVEKIKTYRGALQINVYKWRGASYYWARIYEKRINKMEKLLEEVHGGST